jgi:hypothetical protein
LWLSVRELLQIFLNFLILEESYKSFLWLILENSYNLSLLF